MPNNTSLPRRAATRRFSAITTFSGGAAVYDAVTGLVAPIVTREDAERIAGALENGVANLYAWRDAYPDEVVTS